MRRRYRPCRRFMDGGGIYGRCIYYPWRAYRTRHIFSTCIHLTFRTPDFRQNTANARAFNAHPLHPVFAYAWRNRQSWRAPPPPAKKTPVRKARIPLHIEEWRKAA